MNEMRGSAEDPADVRAELADRARQVADGLHAQLRATGACWGADEAGTAFARVHAARARQLLERLDAAPARLRAGAPGRTGERG
ncbi:hypothetical protein IQ251_18215 [Saccharopolyspora sp. HNM0983]|uniref:Uncharacterized protein n=2 Tax=Saccharopolyspora montiporae TaxID=2781240 RepID=A0A929BDJ5_9PSEU|nr:hypothetical protein [Saccharopolyspora sp. HNM0983]